MNCWIILLLLSCCGSNNGVLTGNTGCGRTCCEENDCCQNSCIQPRIYEKEMCNMRRERDVDCDDHNHNHNEGCGNSGEDRIREKWMPYSEYNDNDRRDYHDSNRNERERGFDCK